MAALELKGIPSLPTTLFLVSALSAVAYRHLVVALLESICLQLPVLLAQNGTTSTCIASGSAILLCLAVARYSNESYDLIVYMKVLGPGHAVLLLGKLLQRPKMPTFAEITTPSVSWMLVDMLTWTAKPGNASSTNSAHSQSAEEDCLPLQCTPGTSTVTDREASDISIQQPQIAAEVQQTDGRNSHCSSPASRGSVSAGQQQNCFDTRARKRSRGMSKKEQRMAGDVHIVRPNALRRSASCPEEAARSDTALALRSHSLSPEAWEDAHGGVSSPSCQLRSHSLELPSSPPDEEDVSLTSHHIKLDDSFGSCADLAALGASCANEVAMESDDDDLEASGSRSPSSSVDGVKFHDALDVQANDAVGSLGMDGDCPPAVRAACPEAFLLQFGALLDEPSAIEALREGGLPSAWGGEGACFGAPDPEHAINGVPWEPICDDSSPGVSYSAWRRPLRCGLFLYKTTAVIEGIAPADVRRFHLDDEARAEWDDSLLELERFPGGILRENCMVAYRAKWPRPFSPRDYLYGRRVWSRPADGGCYCVSVAADAAVAAPAPAGGRAVRVRDFASCLLICSAPGCPGATEVTTVYFEKPCVRPSFINLAVRKGLWPYLLKYVAALREHSAPANNTFTVQLEPKRDQEPKREQACHNSRSRESGRRRSLVRRHTRQQPSNLIRRTVGQFMRRNLLLTATILAVLF